MMLRTWLIRASTSNIVTLANGAIKRVSSGLRSGGK